MRRGAEAVVATAITPKGVWCPDRTMIRVGLPECVRTADTLTARSPTRRAHAREMAASSDTGEQPVVPGVPKRRRRRKQASRPRRPYSPHTPRRNDVRHRGVRYTALCRRRYGRLFELDLIERGGETVTIWGDEAETAAMQCQLAGRDPDKIDEVIIDWLGKAKNRGHARWPGGPWPPLVSRRPRRSSARDAFLLGKGIGLLWILGHFVFGWP